MKKVRPIISRQHLWAAVPTAFGAAFLLAGYEIVRSSSNALYNEAFGIQNLPMATATIPVAMFATVYIYGWLLSRFGPRNTMLITTLASAAGIFIAYLGAVRHFSWASAFLYVFREAYIVLMIEQYWSFLNSRLGDSQARGLNGAIIGVSSLGAVAGGYLDYGLSEMLGTVNLLPIAAALTLPPAILCDIAYRKCGEPAPSTEEKREKGYLRLRLFLKSPVLLVIVLLVSLSQIVSTNLMLDFQGLLHIEYPNIDQQTAYSGRFFAWTNMLGLFFQFVLSPILLKFLPITFILAMVPFIHVVSISASVVSPSLQTVGFAYLLFKALDYSIFRAAKEILYIPLSFDARYRAKEVIDVFGYRFSKGAMSLFVFLGLQIGIFTQAIYGILAVVAAALWFIVTILLRKHIRHKPANNANL